MTDKMTPKQIDRIVWANENGYLQIGKAKRKFPKGILVNTPKGPGVTTGDYFPPTYAKRSKRTCDTLVKVALTFNRSNRPCFFIPTSDLEVR